ncbi:molybdenum cofactor guanylyltransferase [Archaeoglobus profundus]|uniref:Probable molybdenum cofactor guanylyltransferase n=1 Tax=Archaeoglobus profundus (strain DSM 5631 / JCM 9629 / NBRC 100127 / Av18) TaxID=572546 RepID=D2RH34_ARCPA|nr:molybdenum cofactor guanylyltransferase [Archaeoglobus profundus]ADB57609.1 MobA [Archaeoglobus profundus DSM 5631]
MRLNVAILAGGKGSRIGLDKGFLELNGRMFAEILLERFDGCNVVFVCRDKKQAETYRTKFNCNTIIDTVKEFSPLAGIHSALEHFRDYVLIVAVDMPLVRRELAEFLYRKARGYDALIPRWSDGKLEPLLACYSYTAVKEIEQCITRGVRKVSKPFENLKTLYYPIERLRVFDEKLISFVNVNTPKDLEMVRCLSTGTEDL